MKYYIGQIDERLGEYEGSSIIRFNTDGCPSEYLDNLARIWYDEENDGSEKLNEWYWHNGEVICRGGSWQEVTEELYNALPYFVTKM